MKNNVFPAIRKYILEQVESGTVIELYMDNEKAELSDKEMNQSIKELQEIVNRKKVSIRLYSHYFRRFNCKSYHDRRVFLKNRRIKLTEGFDSLYRTRSGSKIESTGLDISVDACDSEKAVSDLVNEYKGYTVIWQSK